MNSTKLLNFFIGANFLLILLNFSSFVTSEDDADHLCITFEKYVKLKSKNFLLIFENEIDKFSTFFLLFSFQRRTMNVSKIVPETVNQTILSICEHNKTYSPCQKRVNDTQMKTIWVEQVSVVPVKICCMGYKKVDDVCKPICSTVCENAVCVGPDKCKCNDGFIRDKKEYGFTITITKIYMRRKLNEKKNH